MGKVLAQSEENDNIIRPERHGIGEGKEKRSPKDGGNAGRRRQIEFADRMTDNRRAVTDHDALDGGIPQAQLALQGEQLFLSELDFEVANMTFDLLQGRSLSLDAVGGHAEGLVQRKAQGARIRFRDAGRLGGQVSDALADVPVNGMDVTENRRGLTMETEHMHFAIDAFCDGDNRLVQRAAGESEFFAEAS